MTEVEQLLAEIKRELRSRGLTYRDVANELGLSEPSVKRVFATGAFTLDRLAQVAAMLNLSLAELTQAASASIARPSQLTPAQERELVADTKLLLVAVCAINHWTIADITRAYRLTEAECVQRLLALDRLKLITLLPGNRIRLNVSRDFDWLPDGPIRRFFREHGEADFLEGDFNGARDGHIFIQGMLTRAAADELHRQLRRFRQQFATLHDESLARPLAERHGTGLLLAVREWEPQIFAKLRQS
ncbi:helix-turn-helix domain-containing protein [Paraburkholderia phosphatilytica]|uniref:helix-turn-helix domain-containing protein n=1 Tax=Paraburkholderia phosphatilytica TaxID=2282883 RepID=UPI000E4BF953|nr:helix-turn-helix transcriptional regulator [Paraburkholderia phosphatilytica]